MSSAYHFVPYPDPVILIILLQEAEDDESEEERIAPAGTCAGLTSAGKPCKLKPAGGEGYCRFHESQAPTSVSVTHVHYFCSRTP